MSFIWISNPWLVLKSSYFNLAKNVFTIYHRNYQNVILFYERLLSIADDEKRSLSSLLFFSAASAAWNRNHLSFVSRKACFSYRYENTLFSTYVIWIANFYMFFFLASTSSSFLFQNDCMLKSAHKKKTIMRIGTRLSQLSPFPKKGNEQKLFEIERCVAIRNIFFLWIFSHFKRIAINIQRSNLRFKIYRTGLIWPSKAL